MTNNLSLNPRQVVETDTYIGKQISIRRLKKNLTQKELACYLGITFQQIQKYELGINRVSASRLFQISEILECDIQSFFPVKDKK